MSHDRRAISDATATHELYLSDANLGDHRLFPCENRPSCPVETMSLDEALPWQQIDFIKIDTQGAETRILAGMHKLIERSRDQLGCLIEFCPGLLNLSGSGLDSYLNELESLHARVHWIEAREDKIILTMLPDIKRGLRSIADQMLSQGVQDLSQDVVVFFSKEAEKKFLRAPEASPNAQPQDD